MHVYVHVCTHDYARVYTQPLIDFANHALSPNSHLRCADDRCGLYALRPISAGEEVTLSYGNFSDFDLMQKYGFVLPNSTNPWGPGLMKGTCTVRYKSGGTPNDQRGEIVEHSGYQCLVKTLGSTAAANAWLETERAAMLQSLTDMDAKPLMRRTDALSKMLLDAHCTMLHSLGTPKSCAPSSPKEVDSMAEPSSYHAGELVTLVSGFGTPARACAEECSPWTCTSV